MFDEFKRMIGYFVPFCCIPLSFSCIRRQGGRRKWKKYGPLFCVVAALVYFYSRSNRSGLDDSIEFIVEDDFLYRSAIIPTQPVSLATLKAGINVHVAMNMFFIGQDPHASASFKDTITWIVVYSSAPIHFHILSDSGSIDVIEKIMMRAERQANCHFTYSIETIDVVFEELLELLRTNVPNLKLTMLQEHVVTKMMPLVLPWYYANLHRVIFVSNRIKFRTDIVELYEHFELMNEEQLMGLTLVQDARFAPALAVHRHLNADSEDQRHRTLGLSPPNGWPGFNTGLMLLDFDKMRKSQTFRRYMDLENQYTLIKQYEFKTQDLLPKLDEWVTLIGAEKSELFYTLPCQWNVQPIMDSEAFEYCRFDIKAMEFDS